MEERFSCFCWYVCCSVFHHESLFHMLNKDLGHVSCFARYTNVRLQTCDVRSNCAALICEFFFRRLRSLSDDAYVAT